MLPSRQLWFPRTRVNARARGSYNRRLSGRTGVVARGRRPPIRARQKHRPAHCHEARARATAIPHRPAPMAGAAAKRRQARARLGGPRRPRLAASRENGGCRAARDGHRDAARSIAAAHRDDDRVRADAADERDGAREEFLPRRRHGRRARGGARARRPVRAAAGAVHGGHHAVGRGLHRGGRAQPALSLVRLRARRLHRRADRPARGDGAEHAVSVGAHARGRSRGRHLLLGRRERARASAQLERCADAHA